MDERKQRKDGSLQIFILALLVAIGIWSLFVTWRADEAPAPAPAESLSLSEGEAQDGDVELARRIIVYQTDSVEEDGAEVELARRIIVY